MRDLQAQIDMIRSNATPQIQATRIADLVDVLGWGDIYMNIHKFIKVGYVYPIDNGRLLKLQNLEDEDINIAFIGKGAGVKMLYNKSPHRDGVYPITEWTDITKYYKNNDVEVFGKV